MGAAAVRHGHRDAKHGMIHWRRLLRRRRREARGLRDGRLLFLLGCGIARLRLGLFQQVPNHARRVRRGLRLGCGWGEKDRLLV